MSLLGLLLVLIVIGVILWFVEAYIPMPQPIKVVIYVIVLIFVIILLFQALGLDTGVIAPGMLADFIAVDLHHPSLTGWNAEDFLDVLFFGASADAIVGTWVQGKKVSL